MPLVPPDFRKRNSLIADHFRLEAGRAAGGHRKTLMRLALLCESESDIVESACRAIAESKDLLVVADQTIRSAGLCRDS